MIVRKSAQELEVMARAGEVVAETLALLGKHAQPGTTTAELDRIADEFIRSRGGVPTFKGYRGPYPYPASICTSRNASRRLMRSCSVLSRSMGIAPA